MLWAGARGAIPARTAEEEATPPGGTLALPPITKEDALPPPITKEEPPPITTLPDAAPLPITTEPEAAPLPITTDPDAAPLPITTDPDATPGAALIEALAAGPTASDPLAPAILTDPLAIGPLPGALTLAAGRAEAPGAAELPPPGFPTGAGAEEPAAAAVTDPDAGFAF